MIADPILTIAALVLAHLVADFIVQTGGVVAAKTSTGVRAMGGLLVHGAGVGICLVPAGIAFGAPGWAVLATITVSHVLIDWTKVLATRRVERIALARARRRHEGTAPDAALGRAWTPLPAAFFALDQLAHLAAIGVAWTIWLAAQPPTPEWSSAAGGLLAGRDLAAVHDVVLVTVVLASLLIVNVRGGALFVATLVRPLELSDAIAGDVPADARAAVAAQAMSADGESRRRGGGGWSFRIGPLAGRVEADPNVTLDSAEIAGERVALPPPVQVGATIGVLERLLIVTFVLAGADAAIGFVVGAKTLARFRLLDDRDFAEYYLLGTLASVGVAVLTAIIARAALQA